MAFKCCFGCVAPKRYPGCHGTCPEYLKEREEYDKRKDVADRVRYANQGITEQRSKAVHKALKGRKVK